MIGEIIGDIAGSRYAFHNYKCKYFPLFVGKCRFTDDSVMALAIAKTLKTPYGNADELSVNTVKTIQTLGRQYCGSGCRSHSACSPRQKQKRNKRLYLLELL